MHYCVGVFADPVTYRYTFDTYTCSLAVEGLDLEVIGIEENLVSKEAEFFSE